MFFKKKYSFEINRNKDILTATLKNESPNQYSYKNGIGMESTYQLKSDWDQFIISREQKIFQGLNFYPDAYIKLVNGSEQTTEIKVEIKLSSIWLVFLIFMHAAIIVGFYFTPHLKLVGSNFKPDYWLNRVLIILFNIGTLNLIIWLTFLYETKRLKAIIKRVFEDGLMKTSRV